MTRQYNDLYYIILLYQCNKVSRRVLYKSLSIQLQNLTNGFKFGILIITNLNKLTDFQIPSETNNDVMCVFFCMISTRSIATIKPGTFLKDTFVQLVLWEGNLYTNSTVFRIIVIEIIAKKTSPDIENRTLNCLVFSSRTCSFIHEHNIFHKILFIWLLFYKY